MEIDKKMPKNGSDYFDQLDLISSHHEQAKLIDELKKRIEELKLNLPPLKTDEQVRAEMDAMQAAANEAIAKIYDSQAS
jgi:chaperonin cofactor prefoldin